MMLLFCFVFLPGQRMCFAEVVTGSAVIVNGNVNAAREAARQDAMRSYAERQVGVYVDSHTEVSLNMLISDRIVTDSRGYVK